MTKHVRSAALPFLCLACVAFCRPQVVASLGVSRCCCKFTPPSSVAARLVLSSLRRLKRTSISFRRVAVLLCCCPNLLITPNLTSAALISSTLLMLSPTSLSFYHFNFPSYATCFTTARVCDVCLTTNRFPQQPAAIRLRDKTKTRDASKMAE
jgi:hypothetical protein